MAAFEYAGRRLLRRDAGGGDRLPEIFNTNQGSQFTSFGFTTVLKEAVVRIRMDRRGRCMDNIFIERLWRSVKHECIYLNAFETGSQVHSGLTRWIGYCHADRPHSALDGQTPSEVYDSSDQSGSVDRQLAA